MADVRRTAPQVLKYVVVALVIVVVVALVYLATGGGTKTGTAYFRFANSINPGDAVKVLGMDIGKVDKLTPAGDKIRVDFHYDSKVKLPAEVKAAILSPTLVATRFIQLDPAYTSGPEFENGGTIPVERTAIPLEFDELKKQLDLISEDFGPNGTNKDGAINRALTVINKNGIQNGVGQGQPFHDMIVELSKAAKTLSDGRGDLFGTVDNLAHFSSVLNRYDRQIVEFQQNLGDVSAILDNNDKELQDMLTHVEEAGHRVAVWELHNGPALTETVDRAGSVMRAISKVRDSLAQTLHIAPNTLTNFTNLFHPRTGQLYGAAAISGYPNSLGSPANQVCALLTSASQANEYAAQQMCAKALGPVFAQLIRSDPGFQNSLQNLPPLGPTVVSVPQGSTPSYGDLDQADGQADVNPSPNGTNSDLPRSSTANGNDHSYSDGGFPLGPLGGVSQNPQIPHGGN
jgi:phospholipid/cholesterol/gamma-HCH transport system substrate-binding protein